MGGWQYIYLLAWFAAAFAIGLLLKKKTPLSEAGRFAIVFLFLMAVPPLGIEYFKIYALPQPSRYFVEMDVAFAMVAGMTLGSRRLFSKPWSRALTAIALLALAIVLAPRFRKEIRGWLPRDFDITKTVEYQRAVYLKTHYPGQRVFVTGTTGYWFNVFGDNPQLGGVADQGRSNPANGEVDYLVANTVGNGRDTVAMLKACGIRAIAVSGKHTREVYPFPDAPKFAGVVPEVWREGDDAIYEIPGSGSLAHVMNKDALVNTWTQDYPALTRYAAAVDADPQTRLVWNGPNRAAIQAYLEKPRVLSVQISYDPGWRVTANGASVPTRKDALGFLVLEPDCHGRCTVDLVYDGGTQARIMRLLCISGFTACAYILFYEFRRKRRASAKRHASNPATVTHAKS